MTGLLASIRATRETARRLRALREAARSDTCVIVGNGPSLNAEAVGAIDLDAADVYISNFACEHPALFGRATVLGIVNPLVVEQAVDGLAQLYAAAREAGETAPVFLLPTRLASQVAEEINPVTIAAAPTPGFQEHHCLGASTQSTVTYFLLQLAFWVGYKRVTLIGVDNTYSQPDVEEGVVINQVEADANHFSSDYFRGRRWEAANTQRMAAVIALAARVYARNGRELTNSTEGGALEVLPRVPLASVLAAATSGAPMLELGVGRVWGWRAWSVLRRLRSRLKLGVSVVAALALSLLAVVFPARADSVPWLELAAAGVVLFAGLICAVSLWGRHLELTNQQQFEELSGDALDTHNPRNPGG